MNSNMNVWYMQLHTHTLLFATMPTTQSPGASARDPDSAGVMHAAPTSGGQTERLQNCSTPTSTNKRLTDPNGPQSRWVPRRRTHSACRSNGTTSKSVLQEGATNEQAAKVVWIRRSGNPSQPNKPPHQTCKEPQMAAITQESALPRQKEMPHCP